MSIREIRVSQSTSDLGWARVFIRGGRSLLGWTRPAQIGGAPFLEVDVLDRSGAWHRHWVAVGQVTLIERLAEQTARVCAEAVPIPAVQLAVAKCFKVSVQALCSDERTEKLVAPRHLAMWLARQSGYTLIAIATAFGKDHGTVMNAVQRVEDRLQTQPPFAATAALLKKELGL